MLNEILLRVLYQYTLLIVTNKICLAHKDQVLGSFSFSNIFW